MEDADPPRVQVMGPVDSLTPPAMAALRNPWGRGQTDYNIQYTVGLKSVFCLV